MRNCVDLIANYFGLDVGTVFQIEWTCGYFKFDYEDILLWRDENGGPEDWCANNEYILAELITDSKHIKPRELLTDVERAHIKSVIEPYGYDVWDIRKVQNSKDTQMIVITYDYGGTRDPLDSFEVFLPFFDNNTMFTGLQLNKCYTLEELGIEL